MRVELPIEAFEVAAQPRRVDGAVARRRLLDRDQPREHASVIAAEPIERALIAGTWAVHTLEGSSRRPRRGMTAVIHRVDCAQVRVASRLARLREARHPA